jgi:hypothetical protein
MTDSATGRGARHPRSSRRTTALGSAGMPAMPGDQKMAELEARLDRLEGPGGPGMRERSRALVRKVMPAEASHHFRNAMREQLLGFRSIVDFWIERVDDMEAKADDDDRMRIEVE